jgi:hypothetical protein
LKKCRYHKGQNFGREIKLDSKDPYEKEIFYFIDRVINNEPIEIGNLKDIVGECKQQAWLRVH